MSETIKQPMIYSAIIGAMSDIGAVGKNQKNQQQGFMYRGIDAVMNAINPALIKNKLFIAPEILEQEREERTSIKGTNLIYSICKIKYTVYAEDGSHISIVTIGESMDSGDKATNKAMAIAYKYACFQLFCIPTEEMIDPDAEVQDLSKKKIENKPKKQQVKQPEKTQGNGTVPTNSAPKRKIGNTELQNLNSLLKENGISEDTVCKLYVVENLAELTEHKYKNILEHIEDIKKKEEESK